MNTITTFQACTVAGTRCSIPAEASFINDPFYQTTPSCFNTDPAKPKLIQCLPIGFKSIIPPETTAVNLWTIKNSIFDNCSPTDGADAGCGKYLQCNYYKFGTKQRYTCEPIWEEPSKKKSFYDMMNGMHGIDLVGVYGDSKYELAMWHQTCGKSQFSRYLDIKCSQNTKIGPLVCSPVSA